MTRVVLLRRWFSWEFTKEGLLYFVCCACAAESKPFPDEDGNMRTGTAWKHAASEGWVEYSLPGELVVYCLCKACSRKVNYVTRQDAATTGRGERPGGAREKRRSDQRDAEEDS